MRDAAKTQGRLESFADEFSAILSRQIDERADRARCGLHSGLRSTEHGHGDAAGGGSGKRTAWRANPAPMAEMNMIPFIDVMLVLLVIFMVAAPLLTVGVPVELPKTGAAQLNIEQKPIAVTIDEPGSLSFRRRKSRSSASRRKSRPSPRKALTSASISAAPRR